MYKLIRVLTVFWLTFLNMSNVLNLALVSPIDIVETLSCFASFEVAVLFILNLAFLRGISWLRLVFMKIYLKEKHSFGFDFEIFTVLLPDIS